MPGAKYRDVIETRLTDGRDSESPRRAILVFPIWAMWIDRRESLRHTHGLTMDGLGAVEIFVPDADVGRARSLVDSAEAGTFRLADDAETASTDDGGVPPQDSNG